MPIDWIDIDVHGPPNDPDDVLVVVEFLDGRRDWDVGTLDPERGWLLLSYADSVAAGDGRITHYGRVILP